MTALRFPAGQFLAALLTVLTVSSCGTTARGDSGGGTCKVRHEIDQITSRFPSFKQLESTSWCGITPKSESRVPGPTDVRLVGVLNAVDDKAVLKELEDPGLQFEAAAPKDVPAEIAKLLPEGARWMMSEAVNMRITEDLYFGSFYYDKRSGQVLFDCSNPHRKDGPAPSVVTVG